MGLVPPHGGTLRPLLASEAKQAGLRQEAHELPAWDLGARQLWDLELLLTGAFSPLGGYHVQAEYESVCDRMRLTDDALWPIPVSLDVRPGWAKKEQIRAGDRITLRHPEGVALAVLTVEEAWTPDARREAQAVYGTTDETHPGVHHLLEETHELRLGGRIEGIETPTHHTFQHLRHTPETLRQRFDERGWESIVAFQTRNPMHRAHVELVRMAAQEAEANILLHPVVGRTRPGDIDYFNRVRCYQAVLPHLPAAATMLSLLPLAMRMAGPREALWHALIRQNYGASHFIVGRDHAGPAPRPGGTGFYAPEAARQLLADLQQELRIQILPFDEVVYEANEQAFLPRSEAAGGKILRVSGSELRRRLRRGQEIPAWFSYPEVLQELRRTYPPRAQQGFTVFFTGLSGSGKSTVANILTAKLLEEGSRPVTLLDGDIVRKHLSSELGFSKHDRDLNVQRIGFVASEITKNRGIAVCAPIAPYRRTRMRVRHQVEAVGGFVLVHVATPLEVCEKRDRKGLYAKARRGEIQEFTGISDPYEAPVDAEVVLDTTHQPPETSAQKIVAHLEAEGYLEASAMANRTRGPQAAR